MDRMAEILVEFVENNNGIKVEAVEDLPAAIDHFPDPFSLVNQLVEEGKLIKVVCDIPGKGSIFVLLPANAKIKVFDYGYRRDFLEEHRQSFANEVQDAREAHAGLPA